MPSAFDRYIWAGSGNTYSAPSFRTVFALRSSSRNTARMGMSTVSPVFEVFTAMNPASKSTSSHFKRQQSPRRMAVHMPVTTIGRMKSSPAQASRIFFISSGEKGCRFTVSRVRVTMRWKGFCPSASCGCRCLNVARRSFSVSFHVLVETPSFCRLSKYACASAGDTCTNCTASGFVLRTNSAKSLRPDLHCLA